MATRETGACSASPLSSVFYPRSSLLVVGKRRFELLHSCEGSIYPRLKIDLYPAALLRSLPSNFARKYRSQSISCHFFGRLTRSICSGMEQHNRDSFRRQFLAESLPPRGLSRVQAASYLGVSPSLFDEMVGDGRMPGPKMINTRRVWDRKKIDRAFDALPEKGGLSDNPWD